MLSWAENVLRAASDAETQEELFEALLLAAQAIGFEYCAYGMSLALPATRPRHFLASNYCAEWRSRYAQMRYVEQDPTVLHGTRSHDALVWSDEVFASARKLWDEAQSAGLRVGWAQANPMRKGVAGMLTLARSSEPLTHKELEAKSLHMRWLSNVAHMGFQRLVDAKGILHPQVRLTEREKEVLKWSAVGKTIPDISEILLISVDTVRFHTRNVLNKLNVANRTAAVAHAVYLGLLD